MLITLVDVVSCENPECREFARTSPSYGAREYYCPVCGTVSRPRTVNAKLLADACVFESYLRKTIASDRNGLRAPA